LGCRKETTIDKIALEVKEEGRKLVFRLSSAMGRLEVLVSSGQRDVTAMIRRIVVGRKIRVGAPQRLKYS
jgi:tRNA(Ile2) C34 agmatinyltransferase TiaS